MLRATWSNCFRSTDYRTEESGEGVAIINVAVSFTSSFHNAEALFSPRPSETLHLYTLF